MRAITGWTIVLALASLLRGQERPVFTKEGKEFGFKTATLSGALRGGGKTLGIGPVIDAGTNTPIAGKYGILSLYRLLDDSARYGSAGWDWASSARLLEDGAVEVNWSADAVHPFDMKAVYRWKSGEALDVVTTVTAKKDLKKMEVFLASYFEGFEQAQVYAKKDGKGQFVAATREAGVWQVFPRDEQAAAMVNDGRWKRPPSPVDWVNIASYAGPVAVRRDAKRGLTAVIMARPEDCFAVLTPFGGEGHRSLYLSLLGKDLKAGESASAQARLVIARELSDLKIVEMYEGFLKETAAK